MKKRQLINLFLYAALPVVQFIIYYRLKFSNIPFGEIVYILIFINSFCVSYVSNLKVCNYFKQYLIITLIYIFLIGAVYTCQYLQCTLEIFKPIINLFIWCQDISFIWMGCFIYNLIRLLKIRNIERY